MLKITKKTILIAFFSLLAILITGHFALAQTNDLVGSQFGAQAGLAATDPRIIIARIIQYALGLLGIIAVSLIIYGGFLWMTSAGNEERLERAKKVLRDAAIGLAIILAAFGIATFVLSRLLAATGLGGAGTEIPGQTPGIGGVGVLGECVVSNVYPTPDQREVSRNTSIMVTFKVAVDPATICNTLDNGRCNGGTLKSSSIEIYKTKDVTDPTATTHASIRLADNAVKVYGTTDNKTFVLIPVNYLGSATDYFWYTVWMNNNIQTPAKKSVFNDCRADYMQWQFEVSNKIDLIPPQIKSGGIFPLPDNTRDTAGVAVVSAQAKGTIILSTTVAPQPHSYATSTATVRGDESATSIMPRLKVKVDPNFSQSGKFVVTVGADKSTATVSKDGVSFGATKFNNHDIALAGVFSGTTDGDVGAGNSWTFNIIGEKIADSLTIGNATYFFVKATTTPNDILVGSTANTVNAIVKVINKQQDNVIASSSGAVISLTATAAGTAGNNISLKTTSQAITVSGLSGGQDASASVSVQDKADQPRNSIIQINFNEPIMPTVVSGNANQVNKVIKIINAVGTLADGVTCSANNDCLSFNCDGITKKCVGSNLAGTFLVSNQYQTVEFKSSNQCGVNGCGDPIYCLPESSNIKIVIAAASLPACDPNSTDAIKNCSASNPYNKCGSKLICQDANGNNYPRADLTKLDGVMDASLNSLDGNRNGQAEGPASFHNENSLAAPGGDSFQWSFFINNKIEATAPFINSIAPAVKAENKPVEKELSIVFNKLMMLSTLVTGETKIQNSAGEVVHKNINILDLANQGVGYWLESDNVLDSNGDPVKTEVLIKHSVLGEYKDYRAQAGSGVNDIYQNCFKPSGGAIDSTNTCNATAEKPSCCNGVPAASSTCP